MQLRWRQYWEPISPWLSKNLFVSIPLRDTTLYWLHNLSFHFGSSTAQAQPLRLLVLGSSVGVIAPAKAQLQMWQHLSKSCKHVMPCCNKDSWSLLEAPSGVSSSFSPAKFWNVLFQMHFVNVSTTIYWPARKTTIAQGPSEAVDARSRASIPLRRRTS